MKYTDYKFNHILRNGPFLEVKTTFYEGNYKIRKNEEGNMERIYVRGRILWSSIFMFSRPMSNDELRKEMNKELAKDLVRVPIDEQKYAKTTE